jgi:flagellar biosynthesis/type III secretory pathway protein FliH
MTEKLMEKEDIVFDSPYLRRIREEADKEGFTRGIELGREKWFAEGHELGRAEGREEGNILTLRETILDALALRLEPPLSIYRSVDKMLDTISDEQTLRSLFKQVLEVKTGAEFQQAVKQAKSGAQHDSADQA